MSTDSKHYDLACDISNSVDLAYTAMEHDLMIEIAAADRHQRACLGRVLSKLQERRTALNEFKRLLGQKAQ